MFGNKNSGEITFYYNNNDVFNDVGILSAYLAKSVSGDSGSIDDFAMTEDEMELFNVCVKQTLPNIYESIIKMTSGVDSAFSDSVKLTKKEDYGLEREAGTYIELNVLDNAAYNENVLKLVDATLIECIKYGVLAEFYSININADLQSIANAKFVANISQLKQRLFQLKKKTTSSLFV